MIDSGTTQHTHEPKLPDFRRFAWMFLFQPIQLHERLVDAGIDDPTDFRWPFRRGDEAYRTYFIRCFQLLLLLPMSVLALATGLKLLGIPFDLPFALQIMAAGAAVGWLMGVAFGWAGVVACAFAFGLAGGALAGLEPLGDYDRAVRGAVGGTLFGLIFTMLLGVPRSIAVGNTFTTTGGLVTAILMSLPFGVTFFVAFITVFMRIPSYLIAALTQIWLTLRYRLTSDLNLDASPIFKLDLIYFPLPLLARHIEDVAADHPAAAQKAMDRCFELPGQYKIGRRVSDHLSRPFPQP